MPNAFEEITGPIFAADFDYFRIPREKWELMLARLKQMGVQALTVAVPWSFHALSPDTIDLSGITAARRNLEGLLQLCRPLNFYCILKPGPYSHSGVLHHGLPLWLSKGPGGLETALPAAMGRWFETISQALAGYQQPDGPIMAVQIEPEADQVQPVAYSEELTQVKWPIWLRKHYAGIEALNAAYGTQYHTVNEVAFPLSWSQAESPLEKDAKAFMTAVQAEQRDSFSRPWREAGWQIPVYTAAELPAGQSCTLTNPPELVSLAERIGALPEQKEAIFHLRQPIQVDPEPVEIGTGPVWAAGAPIRPDGSVRLGFWPVRQALWSSALTDAEAGVEMTGVVEAGFRLTFKGGSLVTASSSSVLQLSLPPGIKPAVYRLRLTGELLADEGLKTVRGKMSGRYLAEDETGQVDLVLVLDDPDAALPGFGQAYLGCLLAAQAQTLRRSAALARNLSQELSPEPAAPGPAPQARSLPPSYTVAEARRGLREADTALRKAMAAVGGLESAFEVILGKSSPAPAPRPAAAPMTIRPEILEGAGRDILLEAGAACAEIVPGLERAANAVDEIAAAAGGLTVAHYQHGYTAAVTAAGAAREPLLKVIARLRLEIASETLPLVAWRTHNQVQEIAESLRWGVMRGLVLKAQK